jgi:hypothetical protein
MFNHIYLGITSYIYNLRLPTWKLIYVECSVKLLRLRLTPSVNLRGIAMGKKQKSVSIPPNYMKEISDLYEKFKDVCEELEISSPSELFRILARLGKSRFLEIVEQVRATRKEKSPH